MSVPAGLMMSQFQGMAPNGAPMSGAPNSIQPSIPQTGLMSGLAQQMAAGPASFQLGPWSQLAYQMAGSPLQGPYPSVVAPSGTGISGTAAGAAGGIGGLLGQIAQNPSLAKNLANAVGGLMNPAVGTPAWESAITSGTSAGIPAASAIAAPTAADVASSIGAPASGALYGGAQAGADAGLAAGSYPTSVGGATVIGGADGAAPAAADAAGSAAPTTGLLGTAAAGSLAAAGLVLPILSAFGVLKDDTLPPGASFVSSLQGAPGQGPNAGLFAQQANQAYGQTGEAGFGQWLNNYLSNGGTIQAPAGTPKMRNKPT